MTTIKLAVFLGVLALGNAVCPNGCSGHGTCDSNDNCACYEEGKTTYFGAKFDPVSGNAYVQNVNGAQIVKNKAYTGADCSERTCPRGMSWNAVHTVSSEVVHEDNVECSSAGICDRTSGACECFPGFAGAACHKTACPNDCNGHGVCMSNIEFAKYGGARYVGAWDSGLQYGCKCDSGHRGVDCALKECPSEEDPLNFEGAANGRDCSGRGLCDYTTGTCECFSGFTGVACATTEALI